MLDEGLIRQEDYNYPLVQFYQYKKSTVMKGADKGANLVVEYAATLRVEFIPEGATRGPVKDIYFKGFDAKNA